MIVGLVLVVAGEKERRTHTGELFAHVARVPCCVITTLIAPLVRLRRRHRPRRSPPLSREYRYIGLTCYYLHSC